MVQKCTHKGCGKDFADESEPCIYHPGAPVFHEGQKGWECCKTRVLTFDEFMEIPGCTTGTHTTIVEVPKPKPKPKPDPTLLALEAALGPAVPRTAVTAPAPPPPPEEDDEDEPDASVPANATCKRRGCGQSFEGGSRDAETCTFHPGVPLFHEGSKGWTCCKKRVLEFDEFLKLPGCKTRERHCFVGKKKNESQQQKVDTVRSDFYQTTTSVIASFYLKGIQKDTAKVEFSSDQTIDVDLTTGDSKRYATQMELYGKIVPEKSTFRITPTKLEFTLAKVDGAGWPVLRSTDPRTGEIIQSGRAGTMK